MKIFNWMHKRFHHSTLKDGFSPNVKKTEPATKDIDSQALLKEVALADVLCDWNDGILTIGTLGFDQLKSFNRQEDYSSFEAEGEQYEGEGQQILIGDCEEEDDNYNLEHEELNPLMRTTFEHKYEDFVNGNFGEANGNKQEVAMNGVLPASPAALFHEIAESIGVEIDESKKKGERITLADLFLADSDAKMMKMDSAKAFLDSKKTSSKGKDGLSFAKKLIKDNTSSMKNIRKMMKKMLKKKIHPEFDSKNQKPEGQEHNAAEINKNNLEANDLISLLST